MKLTCPQCDGKLNTSESLTCPHCGVDIGAVLEHLIEREGPLSDVAEQLRVVV